MLGSIIAAVPAGAAPAQHPRKAAARVSLSSYESRILSLVNGARVSRGLVALSAQPGTTDVARRWSATMAATHTLAHNPNLVSSLAHAGSAAWTRIAENVGYGPANDPRTLFDAYMASPRHRDNILNPRLRYIGMGTVQVDSADGPTAWNTMDFTNAYTAKYGAPRTRAAASVLPLNQIDALFRFSR
jgi:uncharacterized protein YkwD